MSYGCYLELINRAFNKIEISVEPTDKKEWGKPAMNKTTYNLSDNDYYRLDEYEMTPKGIHVLTAHGHFRVTISIDGEKEQLQQDFDLEDGRHSGAVYRSFIYPSSSSGMDYAVLVSRGKYLQLSKNAKKESGFVNDKGCYKFEFFRLSARRFGVMNDYHFGDTNCGSQASVVDKLINLQKRPEFIVMPGDLLDCPTAPAGDVNPLHFPAVRDIWGNLIDGLEEQSIPVADGLGNHDLWTGFGGENVKGDIQQRNKKRIAEGSLFLPYGISTADNAANYGNKGYHYTWFFPLEKNGKKVLVAFFMLNNLPGNANRTDPGDTGHGHDEGTYAFGALDYLKASMQTMACMPDYDYKVGIPMFHINYGCDVNGDTHGNPERWWTYADKKALKDVLDKAPIKIVTAFFGHEHVRSIEKQTLYIGDRKDPANKTEYSGYRCACSIDKPRLNIIDLELVEENGHCKIKITPRFIEVAKLTSTDDCLPMIKEELQSCIEL